LVTLEQDWTGGEVKWHTGPATQTFTPKIYNSLEFQVRFRYKNPFGGHANYQVVVDRRHGPDWARLHTDAPQYLAGTDDTWHTQTKEYVLNWVGSGTFEFQIGVSIKLGGSGAFEEGEVVRVLGSP